TATVSSIPIWQTPSMDSMLTGVLTPQKEVIVLEEEDEWLFVGDSGSNSALGWVLKNDVKFVEEAFEETPNPRQETVLLPQIIEQKKQQEQQEVVYYTSKIPSLNVRELPSTNAPVIGKLTPANKVRIVENHYEWVKIEEVNVPSFKSGWVIYQSLKEQ
ncbi:MAG: SH3 domain-containing protein, partial [Helicobacter sp.]|nr:SH3 domain-containing protein [Helicobacter sp.]